MSGECDNCDEHCLDCKCETIKFKSKSLKEITNTLVEGIINAYKECPDSQNKTFEEVAKWAGQHVLLTEKELENCNIKNE